jgi:hypothetical protein
MTPIATVARRKATYTSASFQHHAHLVGLLAHLVGLLARLVYPVGLAKLHQHALGTR